MKRVFRKDRPSVAEVVGVPDSSADIGPPPPQVLVASGSGGSVTRPRNPKVSVVLPVMNEARNLPWTLSRLADVSVDELLLVDGGSTDDTVAVAQSLWPDVVLVDQEFPGKGAALTSGMLAATGDIVVMLDGDGSMDPHEIPAFVGALLAGADVVKGSRYLPGGGSEDLTLLRTSGNRALTVAANLLYRTRFSELCYGYAAFWADALVSLGVQEIHDHHQERSPLDGALGKAVHYGTSRDIAYGGGFEIETMLFCRASLAGLRVTEVASFERDRMWGNSNLATFRDGARVAAAMFWERKPDRWRSRQSYVFPGRPDHHTAVVSPAPVPLSCSVVICAYTHNRWDLLCDAVQSALDSGYAPVDVIVAVDNNPALAADVAARFPGVVRVTQNPDPQGLSANRNAGVAAATGDVVLFLDDDATGEPGWISSIMAHFEDPAVGVVGGLVSPLFPDGRPSWLSPALDWVVGCSHSGMPAGVSDVRNVIGANMAVRRSLLVAMGGFDTTMTRVGATGTGGDDTELCIRASSNFGVRVVYDPSAVVTQVVPSDRLNFSYLKERCVSEGRSKARLASLVPAGSATSEERAYVRSVLPSEIASDMCSAAPRRAFITVVATVMTAYGFAAERSGSRGSGDGKG